MKKFVVIVNEKCATPTQINAVGHLCLGIGNLLGAADGKVRTFKDRDKILVSSLTDYPLIILAARSSEHLRTVHQMAVAESLLYSVFVECMRSADPDEQEAIIATSSVSEHEYIAVLLFGNSEELKPLTKRFSLLREKTFGGG